MIFDWIHFKERHMNTGPFVVQALIDYCLTDQVLIDIGCLSYGVISK